MKVKKLEVSDLFFFFVFCIFGLLMHLILSDLAVGFIMGMMLATYLYEDDDEDDDKEAVKVTKKIDP